MTQKEEACALCRNGFFLEPNQEKFYWVKTWCEGEGGHLCPSCAKAAKKLGAARNEKDAQYLGVLPWGSDILKESESASREVRQEKRQSENYRTWVEKNHPEWLD